MNLDEPIRVRHVELQPWELWFTTSRASGPGGQHVNKTSSRVTLHWDPGKSPGLNEHDKRRVLARLASRLTKEGVLQISVQEHSSQHRNRAIAIERLCELLDAALQIQRRRKKTRPSRGAVRRRLQAKRERGDRKKDRGWKYDPD